MTNGDRKEIMNLIKYKKMLGGRKMELEKAIKTLKKTYCMTTNHALDDNNQELKEAITTVLSELENRYNKGYQDGFKQAKFDCEMDKLNEPSERIIKIKDEYLLLVDMRLYNYDGCNTVESLKELIDEARDYIHKALRNDDKSVITVNSKKKFNILGEEVK